MKDYNSRLKDNYFFLYGVKQGEIRYKNQIIVKIILTVVATVVSFVSIVVMGNSFTYSVIAGLLLATIVLIVPDILVGNKVKKRRECLKLGLADFMDHTVILLESGMSLWNAITETAVRQGKEDCFAREVLLAVNSYSGKEGYYNSPEEAMIDMAERCSTVMVSSFVSTVIQNSRKGSDELVHVFKNQAASYRSERRYIAKKRAEEASTLMLLPTAMVFSAVIALVTTPAVLTVISGVFS